MYPCGCSQRIAADRPSTRGRSGLRISIWPIGFLRVLLVVVLVVLLRFDLYQAASVVFLLVALTEGMHLWSRSGLWRVTGSVEVAPDRLFPGEEARCTIRLTNNKPWPVFLEIDQQLPRGLAAPGDGISTGVALNWHDMVVLDVPVQATRRGCYSIPPLQVVSRDVLGFYRRERAFENTGCLLVYPRIKPPQDAWPRAVELLGEQPDRRAILPDPARVMGLREYTPGAPSRFIHWKASARHNRLQLKVLDPTTSLSVLVAVDVSSFAENQDEDGFEEALSLAAGFADRASDQRLPFGLLVNGEQVGTGGPVLLPPSRDTDQLSHILEALARVQLIPCGSIGEAFAVLPVAWRQVSLVILHGVKALSLPEPPACRSVRMIACPGRAVIDGEIAGAQGGIVG